MNRSLQGFHAQDTLSSNGTSRSIWTNKSSLRPGTGTVGLHRLGAAASWPSVDFLCPGGSQMDLHGLDWGKAGDPGHQPESQAGCCAFPAPKSGDIQTATSFPRSGCASNIQNSQAHAGTSPEYPPHSTAGTQSHLPGTRGKRLCTVKQSQHRTACSAFAAVTF